MVGLSAAGEALILTPLTATATVSLHTGDPGLTGAANEVSGGAYARQSAAFTNTGSNPTVAANSAIITFPTASAGWGTITFFGVWNSGVFSGSGTIASKTINSGDAARFAAGALTITAN